MRERKDFFISFTAQDKAWAEWIASTLEANGYSTVFQGWDFRPGHDFIVKMREAVAQCERLIAVFSPAYFRSGPAGAELDVYLGRDWSGHDRRVIPVLVEPVAERDLLQSRLYIDVSVVEEDEACHRLLEGVSDRPVDRTAPRPFPGQRSAAARVSTAPFPRRPLPPNNLAAAGIARNDAYVPRGTPMAQLERALAAGATVALTQALQGDGGFGKTEIARAFVYAHALDFDGLWWVDASRAGHGLATETLATALGLQFPPDCDRDQLRALIAGRLSEGRHLLVLDNVDDPATLGAWPVQPPAVRLITTRLHGPAVDRLHPVEVSALTPEEARALLRQSRGDLASAEHEATLDAIAGVLGHHALAVALSGAWLSAHITRSPAELLAELRRETGAVSREVLEQMTPRGVLAERYARGVFASLTLHLGDMRHSWSRTVLEIAAFLHPGGIPLALLAELSKDWPLHARDTEAASEDAAVRLARVSEAVEELHGRSLVTLEDGVIVHRLAQRAVRAGLEPGDRTAALRHVLVVLDRLLANALDPMQLARHAPIIPHAAAALALARDAGVDSEAGELAVDVANYSHVRSNYAGALAAAEQAERQFRAAYGDEHEKVAVALGVRGFVLRAQGDLDGALRCYQQAERIDRKSFGDDHPKVATRVNNRGEVLRSQGDLAGALRCYEEAERIDRKAFGDDHPEVATDVNNRGAVLHTKGDLDGALRCFEEAERIDRKAFGDDHPNVAIRVGNRGSVLQDQGDLDGALRCYEEAERIDRKAFGDDHPRVATDVHNRGAVLLARGDLDGARACCRLGFSCLLRKLGPRAGDTLAAARNLAAVGLDPIALSREIAGSEVAAEFARWYRAP